MTTLLGEDKMAAKNKQLRAALKKIDSTKKFSVEEAVAKRN